MSTAYAFFLRHADYSYRPGETSIQGRRRCAKELARSEAHARKAGYAFHWEIDADAVGHELRSSAEPYALWGCTLTLPNGEVGPSLWAIDFGPGGEPWGEPYRRVVEAQLALEAMSEIPNKESNQ